METYTGPTGTIHNGHVCRYCRDWSSEFPEVVRGHEEQDHSREVIAELRMDNKALRGLAEWLASHADQIGRIADSRATLDAAIDRACEALGRTAPMCKWARAGHGPCEGPPEYRVVYRSPDRSKIRSIEEPYCFRHALTHVDRAWAAGSIAVVEFEPIPKEG